ncbi:hypothetical protein H5410_052066 [Solanum commersonii]|uniref:Formin-like protein n=1 Tax=Solanum commersonii TaxID=4109 RepID=A0A9J5X179_SOLCO|nr:hypothetical protein H5410_052066 [Solanum commersonii]
MRVSLDDDVLQVGDAPAPAPAPATSSFETLNSPPPARHPTQPFFPRDYNDSSKTSAPSDQSSTSQNSTSDGESNKTKSSTKSVLVAVLVTAAVTFIVVALFFICYCKVCGVGYRKGKNDERPLLSLIKHKHGSAGNHLVSDDSHSKMGKAFYMEPSALNGSKSEIPLGTVTGIAVAAAGVSEQIPPGRMGMHGQPPLKPPPGRVNPFEDPTSPAPPPLLPAKITNLAAPSPPPPPPPPKPSAGVPRPPAPGPPPPPPIPIRAKAGPRPPPPPGPAVTPPRPPPTGLKPPRPSPLGSNASSSASVEGSESDPSKTKLKPFFWDKVLANPDHSMSLFGYAHADKDKNGPKKDSMFQDASKQYVQIIVQKKAQNLAILLKALNVTTEEVCDALKEGNELPSELLQTLLKMAPTADEELKLRLYNGDLSRLGPAERFLKILVDIPFAFKRLESLLFMCSLEEEASMAKESFATLEAACTELRKSRLFHKLLEAVLKTGNRMNDGTFRGGAQAFKLDTLLKLSDVKRIDGKTTLLHFVVQEIIRSEGIRAARARDPGSVSSIKSDDLPEDQSQDAEEYYRSTGLQVVSGLSSELENVKKAAILDADSLTGTVSKLGRALKDSRDFLNSEMKNNAELDIMWLFEEEKRIMALVKSTGDYFHGNAGKDEGLRLFVIVRDFLIILDKVCIEVKNAQRKLNGTPKKENVASKTSESTNPPPLDLRQKLFPAITDRRIDDSSSDDDAS